jgi:UDP-N-acetylglucosamine 3-dehydrogenase
MWKVAVVGLGHGRNHIAAYQRLADVQVVLLCDTDKERLADAMQQFGVPEGTTDIMEVAHRDDVQIVSICTPDHLHYAHAKPMLQAGKHVLIEKPMATKLDEALELAELAEQNGCVVMVGNVLRFVPSFREAHAFVRDGKLGRLHYAEGTYLHDVADIRRLLKATPWRAGKGDGVAQEIMFGGGVHPADLLRWMAGEPDEVFAYAVRTGNLPEYPLPDQVVALLKFGEHAIGKIWVSIAIQGGWGTALTLCGASGTLKAKSDGWELYLSDEPSGYRHVPFPTTGKPMDAEIAHFVECVRDGKKPLVDAWDGAQTVALLDAAVRSYQTGQPQPVRKVKGKGGCLQ